jgi:major membrane immunogen (membrane-anchored lipoprotein)
MVHSSGRFTLLLACAILTSCGKSDNGTGTYAEDGKEIAKKGSFEGQETHGQVGTVGDQTNSTAPVDPSVNRAE